MANDCWNFMGVTGDKDTIRTIMAKIDLMTDKEGVFETLIGIDLAIPRNDMWTYNYERYGCRSDINNYDFDIDENCDNTDDEDEWGFSVNFTTPWTPPVNFYLELSRMYQVEVEYTGEECGDNIYRRGLIRNGEVIEDFDWTYDEGQYYENNDYFWESLQDYGLEYIYDEFFDEEKPDDDKVALAYIENKYCFVNETDMEEIKSLYKSYKDEQLSSAN
jgi:hypothetical protein